MEKRITLALSAAAVVAMCAFVFAMSAMPADDSTELSTGVIWHIVGLIVPGYDQLPGAEQLRWQEALQHPVRKAAHFLEYAALGALALNLTMQVARERGSRNGGGESTDAHSLSGETDEAAHATPTLPQLALAAWVFATAYAATDELHQLFVPGRTGQLSDVALDSVGSLTGTALFALIMCAIKHHRTKKR